MTTKKLRTRYFMWLCNLVGHNGSYFMLLDYLHRIQFTYVLDMDGNRAEDGINLRYKFGEAERYSDAMIASYLDISPCSVLEMMAALAFRCEEHLMCDDSIGDRTGVWFWEMIKNLGLASMSDRNFNQDRVEAIITDFLDRDYEPDGRGGLFAIEGYSRDMRTIEIWYQMCAYLEVYYDA